MTLTSPPSTTLEPPNDANLAASLLVELKDAHKALVDAVTELVRIAHDGVPFRNRFTRARWKLSRTSLTRRLLWARILAFLRPLVGHRAAADLRLLQDGDIALLRASTRHVTTWTTHAALADWPRYCEASRTMRGKMTAGIKAEKELLYPMLEAVSRGDAVP